MSDSSDDSVNVEIPYSKRPEWADVVPISQDDETNDICRIAYTETFKEVFDYLRAILKLDEKSERALELTKDAALLNPANYTVWYYRRLILTELQKDLNDELEFISNVIRNHPKNYQVWQHRRNIVESLQDASDELSFTQNILKRDSKNYHAWQYRQWVIKKFNLWSNEFDYIEQLLDQDVRNNSAWNQRFFCLSNKLSQIEEVQAILYAEIEYTLVKIALCIDNESSWNYLRALVSRYVELNKSGGDYPRNVIDFCTNKMATLADDERSPFLISFIVDYNYLQCKKMIPGVEKRAECASLVNKSIGLLDSLASKYDTIRVNYWNYLASKWREEFSHIIS